MLVQYALLEYWFFCNTMFQIPGPGDPTILQFFQKHVDKYPRISSLWFGPLLPFVLPTHPDTMKLFLRSSQPKYTDMSGTYSVVLPWLGMFYLWTHVFKLGDVKLFKWGKKHSLHRRVWPWHWYILGTHKTCNHDIIRNLYFLFPYLP